LSRADTLNDVLAERSRALSAPALDLVAFA
jgi:hypothetical protein